MELSIIKTKIHNIQGNKVILDFDLSELYEVETRVLKQAVRRNLKRFPDDFMFQLSKDEWKELITNCDKLPENIKFSPTTPFAFTEQGVAMLSSVLNSDKAIDVNISIMRAFVALREHLTDYSNLKEHIAQLEKEMNIKFKDIHQALNYLLRKDKVQVGQQNRERIGFKQVVRNSAKKPSFIGLVFTKRQIFKLFKVWFPKSLFYFLLIPLFLSLSPNTNFRIT